MHHRMTRAAALLAVLLAAACSSKTPKTTPGGNTDGDGVLRAADLQRGWTATWITPSTGFRGDLVFTVDASGAVSGTYSLQGGAVTPGLGGHLALKDAATGKVAGTISFGADTVFTAKDDVVLSEDNEHAFHLKGTFTTTAFPGDLGTDVLDATAKPPSVAG